jgi:20S proteasome alpha/beta subunit
MTVCLAIMTKAEGAVVVVADRTVTGGMPEVEFEHKGSKIERLTNHCMALTAGDALAGVTLFRAVRYRLADVEGDEPCVAPVAEHVRDEFLRQRLRRAEQLLLEPRGTNLKEFYGTKIQEWPKEIVAALDREIQTHEYGLQVLIAGVDTEPHLYVVADPAIAHCFDALGFSAIGSGAPLAMLQCISRSSGPARTINEALYTAHEAKLNAEPTPGVGQETDMALIRSSGVYELPEEAVRRLREKQLEQRTQATPVVDHTLAQLCLLPEEEVRADART